LQENIPIDVILRTKNSQDLLRECLQSIFSEIPVRKVIMIDAGSTDTTLDIAKDFEKVEIYIKPELKLGQATKFGFSVAQTEWVAVIDSDVILRKGWFNSMRPLMDDSDAVEGSRIDHYVFTVHDDVTKQFARFGQTLLKREPVLSFDLDLPFGEDYAIKANFDKLGFRWVKSSIFLADHYTKLEDNVQRRTGIIFDPKPHVLHVPKNIQIQQARIIRRYNIMSRREVLWRLIMDSASAAYIVFKRNFWFSLAYFRKI
jgi:glycosyltransferase involved in cell wall biosynthesis